MLKSYLKIYIHNLIHHKLYSILNIVGLAIGIACFLLIALYIRFELSYDKFFPDVDNIYFIHSSGVDSAGNKFEYRRAPLAAAKLLQQDIPGIRRVARTLPRPSLLSNESIGGIEENLYFADENYFNLFKYNFIYGSSTQALKNPGSIVLTETSLQKYFGNENPMGKTLMLENEYPLIVTGVVKDLPDNTSIKGEVFVNFQLLADVEESYEKGNINWVPYAKTYIQLSPEINPKDVESQLQSVYTRYAPPVDEGWQIGLSMLKLSDLYMHNFSFGRGEVSGGEISTIYLFGSISFSVLFIALVNFVNLSTAKSSDRKMEVAIRKSFGGSQKQIIRQFVGESILFIFIALLLAIALVELLLPVLGAFLDRDITFTLFSPTSYLLFIVIFSIVLGVLAGSYPAFYLSNFKPAKVFKGDNCAAFSGEALVKLLVVFQFTASIVLIIATIVIFFQVKLGLGLDLGFSRKDIVVISSGRSSFDEQLEPFKNMLLSHSSISNVSISQSSPLRFNYGIGYIVTDKGTTEVLAGAMRVDSNYFSTYDIELLSGNDFHPDSNEDKGYIISAMAAQELGWTPEEAIGKSVGYSDTSLVIGVVENVIESAERGISPILYSASQSFMSNNKISVKVEDGRLSQALEYIRASWQELDPDNTEISVNILEDTYTSIYSMQKKLLRLVLFSSIVAIIISCMGLLGLVIFSTQKRTKEIGIRKVMGGNTWGIVMMSTNYFSKLVLISNLIAWPVAYFIMNRWLENYVYRIDLSPLIFIGSGLLVLCIAWLTVAGIAFSAANAKPVLALRYE